VDQDLRPLFIDEPIENYPLYLNIIDKGFLLYELWRTQRKEDFYYFIEMNYPDLDSLLKELYILGSQIMFRTKSLGNFENFAISALSSKIESYPDIDEIEQKLTKKISLLEMLLKQNLTQNLWKNIKII